MDSEQGRMTVLYSVDLANMYRPMYTIDNTQHISAFDRIGYHLELLHMEYGHQTVYISMNPFTNEATHLGIPDKCAYHQQITNVMLQTNLLSLPQGHHEKGLIEFTPHAYGPLMGTNKKIDPTGEKAVHGCMQFFIDGTCVFAYNNFNAKFGLCDIGMGNCVRGFRDWSFSHNSAQYIKKTLTVFVRPFMYTSLIKEATLWRGCYSLNIPLLKKRIDYDFDLYNYNTQHLPFDRIGYMLHIGSSQFGQQSIWVEMDAFTSQHCDVTLPGLNGLVVNKCVSNIEVLSPYIQTTRRDGHIRISPYDYTPGPSGRLGYDDMIMNYGEYGCFQVYDGDPSLDDTQALISYNNFYSIPDIGIGSGTHENKNWTLVGNAHLFESRRFEIATKPCSACYVAPETHEMRLLHSMDIPNVGPMGYRINNYDSISNRPFSRVGYYLELNNIWMYASFDCSDISELGIPGKSTVRFVENGHIKACDGTDIKSKSKIWIRFTPHDYNPLGYPLELLTGSYGCIQIGYKEKVMMSCSNLLGEIHGGFYGAELPMASYEHKSMQIFVNRHEHVPDVVFLVTGQSNSQGTGGYYDPNNEDDQMDENILSWNIHDKSWDIASLERYMGTKPLNAQCFAFHFAKKYIKRFPQRKVGLVVCGAPGQSICRWSHTEYPRSTNGKKDIGDIFDKSVLYMKEALKKSKANRVEGVLWHQSESDFNETHEYYRHRLKHVITEYRRMFNKDLAFIAGEVLRCNDTDKQNVVLRELNHNNDMLTRCAFSKNLPHCGDELHFSTQAHRDLGDMYFEQYMISQYMSILKNK